MADPAGFAKDQLKSIVERIERLEEEKQALADDIKEVYARPRPTASTPRRCARWSACASRTAPSARSRRPCSNSTCTLWGWPDRPSKTARTASAGRGDE